MEYTYLGRTGLKVSRLCLGTMNFGPITSEKDAFAIMDRAVEEGVTFFDTANVYGKRGQEEGYRGQTEEIIGRWFALGGGRRESVVLATKVYHTTENPHDGVNAPAGLSAYKIRRHLTESLRRLQTDHIELYQMHHVDRRVSWDELWGVFEPIVSSGTVDYIGASNFGARHLCYAQAEAEKRHFLGLVSEQHKYSLACRLPELEVIPACEEMGMGVLAWSPLGGGLLSGRVLNAEKGSRAAEVAEGLNPHEQEQAASYSRLCAERGTAESVLALAWTFARSKIVIPIIGPRTMEQFESTLASVDLVLDEETLTRLDEIFPGPGGAAPEAYAW